MLMNAPLRIFVLEDEDLIAMLLEDMIMSLGYEVVGPFANVALALECAGNPAVKIDAAILNVNLGGETSFPVAQILSDRQIPFIFSSGYGDLGANDKWPNAPRLAKPFALASLEKILFESLPQTV